MVHCIIDWSGGRQPCEEGNPHLTIRTAETQIKIDLNNTDKLSKKLMPKLTKLEATNNSYSVGLGKNERKVGAAMEDQEMLKALNTGVIET